ncbi:hypothetical protein SAMN05444157_2555 [Frankineae bacterium MT45]|nr:hypothetical protein SAMN05444157_2555 [Frankineae bacterium MT45]
MRENKQLWRRSNPQAGTRPPAESASRRRSRLVVAVAATSLLVVSTTSCTSKSPSARSTNSIPELSTAPGFGTRMPGTAVSPSAAPTTQAKPTEADFGPQDVRLDSVVRSGQIVTLKFLGPDAATFRVRDSSGNVVGCNIAALATEASSVPGMPTIAKQHYSLDCQMRSSSATKLVLLTSLSQGAFSYEFEKPLGTV